jgi:hypothetical protein
LPAYFFWHKRSRQANPLPAHSCEKLKRVDRPDNGCQRAVSTSEVMTASIQFSSSPPGCPETTTIPRCALRFVPDPALGAPRGFPVLARIDLYIFQSYNRNRDISHLCALLPSSQTSDRHVVGAPTQWIVYSRHLLLESSDGILVLPELDIFCTDLPPRD